MKENNLTKTEKIRIFLKDYYLGQGIYFSIQRIIGGPIILIAGIYLYLNGTDRSDLSYSGFMIFFGIYYILKPFIFILSKKEYFKNFDLNYQLEAEKIILKADKSQSEIAYADFKKVFERNNYFGLRTHANQTIYLCKNQLDPQEINLIKSLKKN